MVVITPPAEKSVRDRKAIEIASASGEEVLKMFCHPDFHRPLANIVGTAARQDSNHLIESHSSDWFCMAVSVTCVPMLRFLRAKPAIQVCLRMFGMFSADSEGRTTVQ